MFFATLASAFTPTGNSYNEIKTKKVDTINFVNLNYQIGYLVSGHSLKNVAKINGDLIQKDIHALVIERQTTIEFTKDIGKVYVWVFAISCDNVVALITGTKAELEIKPNRFSMTCVFIPGEVEDGKVEYQTKDDQHPMYLMDDRMNSKRCGDEKCKFKHDNSIIIYQQSAEKIEIEREASKVDDEQLQSATYYTFFDEDLREQTINGKISFYSNGLGLSGGAITGIVIGLIVLIVVIVIGVICWRKRRPQGIITQIDPEKKEEEDNGFSTPMVHMAQPVYMVQPVYPQEVPQYPNLSPYQEMPNPNNQYL